MLYCCNCEQHKGRTKENTATRFINCHSLARGEFLLKTMEMKTQDDAFVDLSFISLHLLITNCSQN